MAMTGAEKTKLWRKNNPEKVKAYAKMRYKRDRTKALKRSKEWAKKNNGRVAEYHREWRKKYPKYEKIAAKTRAYFKGERKKCEDCGAKDNLQFHHLEPLAYDNFKVLCRGCHRKVHRTFVAETTPFNEEVNNESKI